MGRGCVLLRGALEEHEEEGTEGSAENDGDGVGVGRGVGRLGGIGYEAAYFLGRHLDRRVAVIAAAGLASELFRYLQDSLTLGAGDCYHGFDLIY